MGSTLKQIASIALPVAGSFLLPGAGAALGIPGLLDAAGATTALGGALGGGLGGAAGGALGGGGLGGALKGGALGGAGGYLANGGASQLIGGTQLGNTLGLANPSEGSVVGNALGSTPGVSGGSGLFSNLLSGSGSAPGTGTALGSVFNSSLNGTGGGTGSGISDFSNGLSGTGSSGSILGSTTALPSLSSVGNISTGGGLSSFGGLNGVAALGGAANSLYANNQAQKDLLAANQKASDVLSPYLASGQAANSRLSDLLGTSGNTTSAGYGSLTTPFTAADLQNDPGYQFQLQQGNQALDRQQAAKGNYFSGAALKAAQDYGQGLADTTYNNAYTRDLQSKQQQYGMLAGQSGTGQTAATNLGNIDQSTGNAQAASGIQSSNILNQSLSSLLNGSGAKRLVGYGQNGQPLYA